MPDRVARTYEPGQALFYESNHPLAIYCVRQGAIKLWRLGLRGEQHLVGTRGPGDLVGYRAALAGRPYIATAEALERSQVCAIPRESFLESLREDLLFAHALLARLAADSLDIEDRLVARAIDPARKRIARFLIQRVPTGSTSDGPIVVSLPFSHAEIAHLTGVSPETLSRMLGSFARRGVLQLARRELRILDIAALWRIAR
jgi:CRP/FNR family transcriptional regulator